MVDYVVDDPLVPSTGRLALSRPGAQELLSHLVLDKLDSLAAHVGKSVTVAVLRGGQPLELRADVAEWPGERRCW